MKRGSTLIFILLTLVAFTVMNAAVFYYLKSANTISFEQRHTDRTQWYFDKDAASGKIGSGVQQSAAQKPQQGEAQSSEAGKNASGSVSDAMPEFKPKVIKSEESAPQQEYSIEMAGQELARGGAVIFNVDWLRCIYKTIASIEKYEAFGYYIGNVNVIVDENASTIEFYATLSDTANEQNALEFADALIRQFNIVAALQDSSIMVGNKSSYGGLYSVFNIKICVSAQKNQNEPDKWFINDLIPRGVYRKPDVNASLPE